MERNGCAGVFVWVGVGWVRPKVPGRPHPPGMGTHMQRLSSAVMPLGTGLFGGGNAEDAQCRAGASPRRMGRAICWRREDRERDLTGLPFPGA